MKLDGKIAIVTGANGGIGNALVSALKSEGCKCILIEKQEHKSEDRVFGCDFTSPSEIENLTSKISEEFERIDFLFNVAGIGVYKRIDELSLEDWQTSLSINLTAPFILIKNLLPLLKNSKNPLIFNVGSAMGITPTPGRSAYCSSKFGLRGLSLSLSKELEAEGVDVTLLTLGSVMTDFGTGGIKRRTDLATHGKKYLTPEGVAKFILEIVLLGKRNAEYELFPEEEE